ncbi:MAG: 50S ribosomal protein L19 [Dehalococcoidia bacterium]|nr:MAG: 50S ribosomal protein L19 [Dehalococcoidia bacterium]
MDIGTVMETKTNDDIPAFGPGDTLRVKLKIIEGDRERSQTFEGVVIRVRRSGAGASFTLRKIFQGVGVERTFPLHSPRLENVEVMRRGKVRRAKLYYLRELSSKMARAKVKSRAKDEIR